MLARARTAADESDDEYLDALVKESLRTRPVVPDVARRLTDDVEVGGVRRCLGVTFASVEMRTVLREMLRRVEFEPSRARPERARVRHVTLVPHRGARVVVRDRRQRADGARPLGSQVWNGSSSRS